MKKTINERFDLLIKELGKNHKSFAESIGKAPTVIYNLVGGRNKPGFELLEAVFAKYPEVNPDWLLMGDGEMFRADASRRGSTPHFGDEVAARIEEHFAKAETFYQETIRSQAQQIEKLLGLLGKTEGAIVRPLLPVEPVLQVAV